MTRGHTVACACSSASKSPSTNIPSLARESITHTRLLSRKNPRTRAGLLRTVEMMTTSASSPWKLSLHEGLVCASLVGRRRNAHGGDADAAQGR